MKKARQFDHQVIEIDDKVKELISLYINLFPNQREAAKKIGVSACTINTYNTRSTHIALYVFDKMIRELTRHVSQDEFEEMLGEGSIEQIRSRAKRQNGAQIDHVMYLINPAIRKVLDIYIQPFPSREAGGAHLGLNPRTFTAYFKGQISSFPRTHFWRIVEEIEKRNITKENLLEQLGFATWEEVLIEKERSHTLQVSKDELVETLVQCFESGSLKERDIPRSVANAAERLFGNLGSAIRATMREVSRRSHERIFKLVHEELFADAVAEFNRLEVCLSLYQSKEIQVNKALPRKKKLNIDRIMRPYLRLTQEIFDRLQDALVERSMALHKLDPNPVILEDEDVSEELEVTEERKPIQYRVVRRYASHKSYRQGEIIDHPGLGIGEILSLKGANRMVVQFQNKKYGMKELVMNGISYPDLA